MENNNNNVTIQGSSGDNKESLLRFMQDSDCLESLSKWTNEVNVFEVLNISRAEIRHSNMLGWLLNPNENHGLGDTFLYGIISKLSQHIRQPEALLFLSSDLYSFSVFREWNHIDILLVSNQYKLVLAIENKVGSREHNSSGRSESQLVTYKERLLSQFKDYTTMLVYLTPDGDNPSDDDWIVLNYLDVVTILENVYKSKSCSLAGEASLLIRNYIKTIKKNIIMDQELVNLCNSIYNKHRKALDLIFENRDDVISQVSNNCKRILGDTKGVTLDDTSKSKIYVKFRTTGLEQNFGDVDHKYYYYQFEIKDDHITLMLEYHKEKYEELSDEISEKMKRVRSLFGISEKALKKDWVWNRVWTKRTNDLDDEKWIEEMITTLLKKDGTAALVEKMAESL